MYCILIVVATINIPSSLHRMLSVNFFPEPNGREQSIVQNNHHISMVSTLVSHPLLEQEGSAGGENHVFPPGRLLPGIRR